MTQQAEGPGAILDDVLRTGPFDRALHLAIQARGLSLERLHARLRHRGVRVSVASLSYWQRGRCRPERSQSLRAVEALEEILELPAGALIGLLGPRRPRGRWLSHASGDALSPRDVCPAYSGLRDLLGELAVPLDDQLETLSHHEIFTVGPDRGERSARSRIVFRARRDGVDRHVAIHHCQGGPPPEDFSSELCRVGRRRISRDDGLAAVELLFDRPLAAGETYVVEYEFRCGDGRPEVRRYVRGFRFPTREYLLQVRFADGATPRRCFRVWQPTVGAACTDRQELRLTTWNSVHLLEHGMRPGMYGIRWEWA
ncbi:MULTISPECIES: hypothetical protein [Thermomonospora]|uniref:Uncharacterized protein n=1 Tax=Thermomonospora curvata (strain ATCC 19995 / DSM 43183 / JCM 3096 / KCTC 9072 / NBRC 15933 / NCIMB 10081 / Henssen B9) TaxID=471852 RepID=D1A3V5_THECD|nr:MULTISPECIES: hypothetical protein [Thermomonospora]ACY98008.1 hypothetical protein Tcur_2445 [Thermomonospora curvata DSM 43183]PKK14286.1 MAG: hypothetical protein BUE48_011970 [Thermomonospora sp. CIF 1]